MKITYAGSYNGKDYFRDEHGCYVDEFGFDIFVPLTIIDKLKFTKEPFTKELKNPLIERIENFCNKENQDFDRKNYNDLDALKDFNKGEFDRLLPLYIKSLNQEGYKTLESIIPISWFNTTIEELLKKEI